MGVSKSYFNIKAGKTKVQQLTQGDIFLSFSLITGTGLTRKLLTFYGSIYTVLDNDANPEAEGVNVVLGNTSNMVH